MALTNIDPSTFVVPSGQALLYLSNGHYYFKVSNGTADEISTNALALLGVATTDIPCLVYDADLTAALVTAQSHVSVDERIVANAGKASTIYTNIVGNRKLDKHVFLNELNALVNDLDLRLRAYTTMPNADTIPLNTLVMYVGVTTEDFGRGCLYINTEDATTGDVDWVKILSAEGESITAELNTLLSLIAANTAKIEDFEDRLTAAETKIDTIETNTNILLEHLGLV